MLKTGTDTTVSSDPFVARRQGPFDLLNLTYDARPSIVTGRKPTNWPRCLSPRTE